MATATRRRRSAAAPKAAAPKAAAAKSKAPKDEAAKEAAAKLAAAKKDETAKRAADKAKLAAAKKEKKAEEAARFQKATLNGLEKTAKDINGRFVQIAKWEGRADDHRLAVALNLASAKDRCHDAKVTFKEWCEENLHWPKDEKTGEIRKLSYETVRKLIPIGAAESEEEGAGKLMLEDMRSKNAAANRRFRAKHEGGEGEGDGDPKPPKKGPTKDTLRLQADQLSKKEWREFMDTQAKVGGMKLVPEDEDEAQAEAPAPVQVTLDSMKFGFSGLKARQKMAFAKWVCAEVGGKLVLDEG